MVSNLDSPLSLAGTILGRFGPIGAAIATVVSTITNEYFKNFEYGGIFSRFRTKTQVLTINDIDELTNVKSGTKYFTADLDVFQGAPKNSNTENINYESVRFILEDSGR